MWQSRPRVHGSRTATSATAGRRSRPRTIASGEPTATAGLVPLPASLLAASPWSPTDTFVLGPRGPILYAPRGAPTEPLLDRLARGLVLWGAPVTADRLVPGLVSAIARAADRRLGPPSLRAGIVRGALRALVGLARGAGPATVAAPGETTTGARRSAAAGLVAAAAILRASLGDRTLVGAVVDGPARRGTPSDPIVERAIDGSCYAAILADRLAVARDPAEVDALLAGMLLRDLALAEASTPPGEATRHPLEAAATLRSWLPERATVIRIVVRHHERPDGSGYPAALRGEDMTDLDLVAAAADAIASALPPAGPAALSAREAAAVVGFVVGRRFPAQLAAAASETIAELAGSPGKDAEPPSPASRPTIAGPGAGASLGPQRPA